MERVIGVLLQLKKIHENEFIENSKFIYQKTLDGPVPDTKNQIAYLIELDQAISCLRNTSMVKESN